MSRRIVKIAILEGMKGLMAYTCLDIVGTVVRVLVRCFYLSSNRILILIWFTFRFRPDYDQVIASKVWSCQVKPPILFGVNTNETVTITLEHLTVSLSETVGFLVFDMIFDTP